jgi:hypothetical protein
MNERIKELAITGGIYDCICDPYDKLKNGDHHSSVMVDLERFAEKIVQECISNVEVWEKDSRNHISYMLKQHFGVER